MKTKILVTVVLITFLNAVVYAQSKTTFGIRAGVNFQNLNGKDSNGDKLNNDLKTGFNAGVNAEIPVGIDFFVQPGLLFTTKGAKYEIANVEVKRNQSYIEIPVNFLYKPELGDGRLLLGFGPYAAFAVGGTIKGGNYDIDLKFGNEIGESKSFDAGANLLAGYEFKNKISFQLNAGLGLVNMYNRPDNDNKSSVKNTGFGVSVGYRFQ
jgi:Outer membrane protein beta-barrel domain